MMNVNQPTVAVITSTIGRSHLERAIKSVENQSYPCKHYVFVDGEQFSDAAKTILENYPGVITTYLPMNTGENGWTNSSINAIAPFLVKEDIICYLDDDNWYEPNHIELGVKALLENDADYAFSLRNFYSDRGELISQDVWESIGHYQHPLPNPFYYQINLAEKSYSMFETMNKTDGHIDTNCYLMKHALAVKISRFWYSGINNDTNVYSALKTFNAKGICVKDFTVNYVLNPSKFSPTFFKVLKQLDSRLLDGDITHLFYGLLRIKYSTILELNDGKYPWD